MEAKDVSVQSGRISPTGSVANMAPLPKDGLTADRFDGGVGVGSGGTSFELSDLKNPSSSGSRLSSPPASAPSRLSPSSAEPPKRRRGRPPGARNRQKELPPLNVLLGRTAADGFTPYFTTVKIGEDVLAKVLSFPLNGAQGVCVLSAVGTVSNVIIRPPGAHTSNSLTYQGMFEILSLTGSYVANDPQGKSKTGGLTISIAGANGRVIGGAVAGIMAASPIQMVLGSFSSNARRHQKRKYTRRASLMTPIDFTARAAIAAPTGSIHPDNNATGPAPPVLLSSSLDMLDSASAASADTLASESPLDLSAEDDNETKNTHTHSTRDVQNLNVRPSAPSPPPAFNYAETRNGSVSHSSLQVEMQNRWHDDISAYPHGQGQG